MCLSQRVVLGSQGRCLELVCLCVFVCVHVCAGFGVRCVYVCVCVCVPASACCSWFAESLFGAVSACACMYVRGVVLGC